MEDRVNLGLWWILGDKGENMPELTIKIRERRWRMDKQTETILRQLETGLRSKGRRK